MTEYVTRVLPNGDTIKYRKNPARTPDGKVVPTKKQDRARVMQAKRMRTAQNIMRIEHPNAKPGTKQFGKYMGELLKKNLNEATGKTKSRLTKARAQVCRKGSKIIRCKNVKKA